MLVGTPNTPNLPPRPRIEDGMEGIYRYLYNLEQSIQIFISTLHGTTVGMIGVRGFSATGTRAENFTRVGLPIGGATGALWSFPNVEADVTYMILTSLGASLMVTGVTKTTTGVLFSFSGPVPTGAVLDLVLLR